MTKPFTEGEDLLGHRQCPGGWSWALRVDAGHWPASDRYFAWRVCLSGSVCIAPLPRPFLLAVEGHRWLLPSWRVCTVQDELYFTSSSHQGSPILSRAMGSYFCSPLQPVAPLPPGPVMGSGTCFSLPSTLCYLLGLLCYHQPVWLYPWRAREKWRKMKRGLLWFLFPGRP